MAMLLLKEQGVFRPAAGSAAMAEDQLLPVLIHHGAKIIVNIQFVGSYSKISKTWRWAWANETVQPE
jgi:hypothetical protein